MHILKLCPKWTESETLGPWSDEHQVLVFPFLQVDGGTGPGQGCPRVVALYPHQLIVQAV